MWSSDSLNNDALPQVVSLCQQALGRTKVTFPDDGVIPVGLEHFYGQQVSLMRLQKSYAEHPLAHSAFLRIVLDATEDDRLRCDALQGLLNANFAGIESVCLALLFDDDPFLRTAAIEVLVLLSSPFIPICEVALQSDNDPGVRSILRAIEADPSYLTVPLFYIDAPNHRDSE